MADSTKMNNPNRQEKEIKIGVEKNMKIDVSSNTTNEKSRRVEDSQNEENSHQTSEKKKTKGPLVLHEIPQKNLISFYKYQHYNMSLQQFKEEWDILAIFPDSKAIINIEVKLGHKLEGNKLNLLKEASKQTNNHFTYFQKLFGSKLNDDWNFIKAACVPYLEVEEDATEPCKYCEIYVLNEKEMTQKDLITWIERLANNNEEHTSKSDYKNLVASIIGHTSLKEFARNGLIISPLDYSRKVETSIIGKNPGISGDSEFHDRYLLNTEQYKAVQDKSSFLIIEGDYGTGKTFVLKERAKISAINNEDEKIAYVNLTGLLNHNGPFNIENYALPTVMDLIAKNDLNYKNIEVISCHDLFHQDFSKENLDENLHTEDVLNHFLNEFLVKNSCKHVYIDEMVPMHKAFNTWLSRPYETVCITMKFDEFDIENSKNWIEKTVKSLNANQINLKFNMRNSENVKNVSTVFSVEHSKDYYSLEPEKNIKGNNNYFYINKFNLKPGILAVAAITKYFNDCFGEAVVVLCSLKELAGVYKTITEHFPTKKCVNKNDKHTKDMSEYLKQPDGIFCTSIESFQGAQARNIIIILDASIRVYEPRNYVLRTLAFVIVIESDVSHGSKPILGFEEDCNLHQHKPRESTLVDLNYFINRDKIPNGSLILQLLNTNNESKFIESAAILFFSRNNINAPRAKEVIKFPNRTTWSFFDQKIIENDDIKGQIIALLKAKGQILCIQIDNFETKILRQILVFTKNIIVLTDNVSMDEQIDFYNMCRKLILNLRPKFSVVVFDADLIETFTGHSDYSFFNIIEYINNDLAVTECQYFRNIYNLVGHTIILGVLKKSFKNKLEDSLVILTPGDQAEFEQLENEVADVSSDFVCTYLNQENFENEDKKNELNDLVHKPQQIIFLQIQYSNFSSEIFNFLSLAKNIVIFSGKKYFSQELQKKYNSECRKLILNIRPRFVLVIHDGNIEEFTGPTNYPLFKMNEDTDLHNVVKIVLHNCYFYNNVYNLDELTISLGVLAKYFKDKNEESLVILCSRRRANFEQFKKKVSNLFEFTYYHQENFKNEDTKSELKDLLYKPKQIVFIQIKYLNFSSEIFDLLSLALNIVIFSDNEHWSHETQKKYKSECRNLILDIRPKFSLVIHDGDIEQFSGPADYSFLNMIEDINLHEHYCYHYQNIYNLDNTKITIGVLDKYFKNKNEESLVILTKEDMAMFRRLEKKVSEASSEFVCSYFHHFDLKLEEYKSNLNDLLHNPRHIIFIQICHSNLSPELFYLLSPAINIIIFSFKKNWSYELFKTYNSEYRNLILNIRPKFSLVIHDEDIEGFTGPADHPLLNMIEDTDLHNHIQITKHDSYHFQNIYNLDEPAIIFGVLDKYFNNENEASLVILCLRSRAVFKQLRNKFSNVFKCTYYHQMNFDNEDTKRKFNDQLHKPRQIIFIDIHLFGFTYAFLDLLSLAKNIVIFSNKKYFSDDKILKEFKLECRNLILNIRPKFALVIHDGNIEEFTGTADYPLLNMIEDTDLHKHVNS